MTDSDNNQNPIHERAPRNWLEDQDFEGVAVIDPGGKEHTTSFGDLNSDQDATITGNWTLADDQPLIFGQTDVFEVLSDESQNRLLVRDSGGSHLFAVDVNGNVTVNGTVDGVDLNAHAADTDAHHTQYTDADAISTIETGTLDVTGTWTLADDNPLIFGQTDVFEVLSDNANDRLLIRDSADNALLILDSNGNVNLPDGSVTVGGDGDIFFDIDSSAGTNDLRDGSIVFSDANGANITWRRVTTGTNMAMQVLNNATGNGLLRIDDDGTVRVPNGPIDLGNIPSFESTGSALLDLDSDNNNTGTFFRVTHNGQGEQLFEVHDSGDVTIPNGSLDLGNNAATAIDNHIRSGSDIEIDIDNNNDEIGAGLFVTHDNGAETLFRAVETGNVHIDPDGTTGGELRIGGDTVCSGIEVTGSVTLSSGAATVDTGVSSGTTATFQVALGPTTDDAEIAASIEAQSGGNYVVHLDEINTSVGNPTVEIDILRVR